MNSDMERLGYAQWILERNLAWIGAAEVKVGVILAIDTAMLAGLATAFTSAGPSRIVAWDVVLTLAAAAPLMLAVGCGALAVLPRTQGPPSSFVFFGTIAKAKAEEYRSDFTSAPVADLLNDCLAQIHRNAEICVSKFKWVRFGMIWSFIAIIPWLFALARLVSATASAMATS